MHQLQFLYFVHTCTISYHSLDAVPLPMLILIKHIPLTFLNKSGVVPWPLLKVGQWHKLMGFVIFIASKLAYQIFYMSCLVRCFAVAFIKLLVCTTRYFMNGVISPRFILARGQHCSCE